MGSLVYDHGLVASSCLIELAYVNTAYHGSSRNTPPDLGILQFVRSRRLESVFLSASDIIAASLWHALATAGQTFPVPSLRSLHLKVDNQAALEHLGLGIGPGPGLTLEEACESLRNVIRARWKDSQLHSGATLASLEDLTISEALVRGHDAWFRAQPANGDRCNIDFPARRRGDS